MRRDAAAGIAATLLFFLSVLVIPMAGIGVGILAPLPTLLFFYRWGSPLGLLVPGGSALIGGAILLFLHSGEAIPYFLEMLLLGLFLGTGMRRQWSSERIIGGAALLVSALGAFWFWMSYNGGANELFQYLEKDLRETITATLVQFGVFGTDKTALEGAMQEVVPLLARLLPGIAVSSSLIACWLNVLAARRFCRLHALPLPSGTEWPRWKAPEHLVWAVIVSGFCVLAPSAVSRILGLNILMTAGAIYLLQGFAVSAFYFEKWKLPVIFRAPFYALILLQQFATLGAALVGFFDMWFDFRRLSRKPAPDPDVGP